MNSRPRRFVLAAAVVVAAAMMGSAALAHSGGLAKDGCHRDRAAGERHFHFEDTTDVAGTCIKEGGKTVKVPNVPALTDTVLELRADVEALSLRVAALEAADIAAPTAAADPPLSKVAAYKLCYGAVEAVTWSSTANDTCKGMDPDVVRDFVECFQFEEQSSWASTAIKNCKDLLGIN